MVGKQEIDLNDGPFTLELDPGEKIMAGLSLGYADPDSAVNRIEQPRQPLADFASIRGY